MNLIFCPAEVFEYSYFKPPEIDLTSSNSMHQKEKEKLLQVKLCLSIFYPSLEIAQIIPSPGKKLNLTEIKHLKKLQLISTFKAFMMCLKEKYCPYNTQFMGNLYINIWFCGTQSNIFQVFLYLLGSGLMCLTLPDLKLPFSSHILKFWQKLDFKPIRYLEGPPTTKNSRTW